MPQLGEKHDDAIYYVVAKSLAGDHGYRIASLPGEPYETKYPPVIPWLLSAVWRADSRFPQNLAIATAIEWAAIPPFLWLSFLWFKRTGLSSAQRWIATALLAVSPYTVLFGAGIYTEVLFSVFLIASLLACEQARTSGGRHGWQWAALAGILAGLGYLTRTSGVVAIVSGPAAFLIWKKRREAVAFALAMIPSIAGWMGWVRLHQMHATDVISLYNTDYLGFARFDIKPADLGVVVWTNFRALMHSMGMLVFPLEFDSLFWSSILVVAAVAAIAGLFRQWRNQALLPYILFALLTCVELLVWDFSPNLRLMYPLLALIAAGSMWEGERFVRQLRESCSMPQTSQRAAAWVVGGIAAGFLAVGVWMQFYMTLRVLPAMEEQSESVRAANVEAFHWIAKNVSPSASVLSQNPSLYLYTGLHTASLITLPVYWYRNDIANMLAPYRSISSYASEHKLSYVYLQQSDLSSLPEPAADAMREVQADHGLQPVFTVRDGSIFRVESSEEK